MVHTGPESNQHQFDSGRNRPEVYFYLVTYRQQIMRDVIPACGERLMECGACGTCWIDRHMMI